MPIPLFRALQYWRSLNQASSELSKIVSRKLSAGSPANFAYAQNSI